MKIRGPLLVSSAIIAAAMAGCSSDEKTKEAKPAVATTVEPLRAEESVEVALQAKVKAINYTTREVTLVGPEGHELSFIADQRVQRLGEIRVGDLVNARYTVKLLGELRAPTAEEKASPITVIGSGGRNSQGSEPGGNVMRGVRVVTTVQMIDLPRMLVTLQGPLGDQATVRARSQENLRKLKVGDTIVITYTEALGVSVEKAS